MKRVKCPKCSTYVTFDESSCEPGQSLVFKCEECGNTFGLRMPCGHLVVIENVFHYKQVLPLYMGDNIVGRYQKGNRIHCALRTDDPSVDLNHCTVTVSRDDSGQLTYTLADNNSNTGTFVDNVELSPRERRQLQDGALFTIGATSIIVRDS